MLALTARASSIRKYWDIEHFDTDTRAASRAARRSRCALVGRRVTTPRERSADRRVPVGRHRFGSGRLVHGRIARSAAGDGDRSASTRRAQRARRPPRLTAAHYHDAASHRGRRTAASTTCSIRSSRAFDEPFADSSAIPTYYVSKIAREHVTVALSGDGGDEAFGGYGWRYTPLAMETKARRLVPGEPGARRRRGSARGGRARRRCRVRFAAGQRAREPRPRSRGGVLRGPVFPEAARCPGAARQAADRDPADSPVFEQVTRPYRECPSDSAVQRAQYADLKIYLPNDPLVKVDRMSMAHSLEIRCPLLDHHLVELAFRIPTETKLADGQPKSLLRGLAERRLPDELVHRPKSGFTAPVGAWLAGPYADRFRDDVLGADSKTRDIVDQRARQSIVFGASGRSRPFVCAVGGLDARALGAPGKSRRLSRCYERSSSSLILLAGWAFAFQSPLYAAACTSGLAYFRPEAWAWSDIFASLNLSYFAGVFLVIRAVASGASLQATGRNALLLLFLALTLLSVFASVDVPTSWVAWQAFAKTIIVSYLLTSLIKTESDLRLVLT